MLPQIPDRGSELWLLISTNGSAILVEFINIKTFFFAALIGIFAKKFERVVLLSISFGCAMTILETAFSIAASRGVRNPQTIVPVLIAQPLAYLFWAVVFSAFAFWVRSVLSARSQAKKMSASKL